MIAALIACFPCSSDEDPQSLASGYVFALEGLSDAAVEHSIKSYIRGKTERKSHAFRPSPAEVANFARRWEECERQHQELVDRVTAPALPEPDGPTEDERRAGIERWHAMREALVETDPVPAYTGKQLPLSWGKNPQRWRDRDELSASAQRLIERGFMGVKPNTEQHLEAQERAEMLLDVEGEA
jgi:hypothetical protein